MPDEPTKSEYRFDGWYTAKNGGRRRFSATQALTWLDTNAADGKTYTITLSAVNEAIAPKTLSYSGKTVSVTLSGGDSERMISLSSSGSLFTVGSGVTLTLDNNVTLLGRSNSASLIRVNSGGTLEMKTGSKINGNSASDSSGGGVYVAGGSFTKQSGGIIYGLNDLDAALKNTAGDSSGHAVYVSSGGKKRNATAGEGVTLNSGSVWANAGFDLTDAERVVFVGCSLPLADYEFRNLLLKTVVRKKDNRIRVTIYPGASDAEKKATRERFESLFIGKDIGFEEVDAVDFLTDRDLIWNW